MAFNPSPEVSAAREFAKKFDKELVIILHLKENSTGLEVGYASFGTDSNRCKVAKELGDIAYQAIANELAD